MRVTDRANLDPIAAEAGVTPWPGLYTPRPDLAAHPGSALLGSVGADAAFLADRIAWKAAPAAAVMSA